MRRCEKQGESDYRCEVCVVALRRGSSLLGTWRIECEAGTDRPCRDGAQHAAPLPHEECGKGGMQMSGNGSTQARVLRLDAKDNVLVALTNLRKGETISYSGSDCVLLSDVPAKHKFVTQDVSAG